MTKLLWLIPLIALPCSSLAQSITGTWQGTLRPQPGGKELRIVIKISTTASDTLQAVLYSIDQGGQPIPATSLTRSGTAVKMDVSRIGGSFEGHLNADGNSINGTWTRAAPLPLDLVRSTPATAWDIPEPPPPPKLMPRDANPAFEVSTVKPSRDEEQFSLLVNRSGMLNTTGTSVKDLIKFAYDLHPQQISGGPAWLDTERFDVTGKPDTPGMPGVVQLKRMMRKLLTDRFALAFHFDKKEMSVYAITVAKTGIKMARNDSNPDGLPGFSGRGPLGMRVVNSTMSEFASILQATILERPVVDQTGLGAAHFDFMLKWTPDGARGPAGGGESAASPAAANPDAPPDIFAAFAQQLGLTLQAAKSPVPLLVVDHVEKPSPN